MPKKPEQTPGDDLLATLLLDFLQSPLAWGTLIAMAKTTTGRVPAVSQATEAPKKLTYTQERFIDAYIDNGGNATRAYLAARPGVTIRTAAVEGSKYLMNPEILAAIEEERARLKNIVNFSRERAIQILAAMALTTPDRVTTAMRTPYKKSAYAGLGDARYALHVQKTPEGYNASTPSHSERRAAINDLWEKLGLDKDASETDRVSFLERLAGLGQKLGRAVTGPESSEGGEGPGVS